jgi:imidazolonepropionase-like amidohydrolase
MFFMLHAALAAPDLHLMNVRVLDANGDRRVGSVVVDEGRITAMGTWEGPAKRTVDLEGKTVTPGWIDAHVHIATVPGAHYRPPLTPSTFEALTRSHLAAYVANGVTTVVDVGMPAPQAIHIERMLADGALAPDVVFVGPFLSPEHGYPSVAEPEILGISRPEEVAPLMDAFAVDTFGVKVTWEPGLTKSTWPVHTNEMADAIRDEAHRRGKEVWVHAQSESTQKAALRLQPDVFVHPPAHRSSRAHLETLREREIAVISTVSAVDLQLGGWEPDRLDHPMVALTVPPAVLATAADRDTIRASSRDTLDTVMPHHHALHGIAKALLPHVYRTRRGTVKNSVKQLVDEGIPLLMGSDSGNWPVFLHGFHGPTSTRELVLLHEAGLSPQQVVRAATLEPAKVLGREAELGTIEVGKRAQMVVFEGDLAANFERVRMPELVVHRGEIGTPAEWMARVAGEPQPPAPTD